MATYSTNEFKSGLKVLVDNEPCSILDNEVVKPGKGQAFNRVKFRNLINGRVWERTYKSCLLYTSPSPRDVEESRMAWCG